MLLLIIGHDTYVQDRIEKSSKVYMWNWMFVFCISICTCFYYGMDLKFESESFHLLLVICICKHTMYIEYVCNMRERNLEKRDWESLM